MASKKLSCLLLLLFVLLYLVALGTRPLFIPDETRYAEIPREMISTGDWIVPHLNGLRYFEKPDMGYWMNAISIMILGENNFAVRLPSALSCGFAALLIVLLCRVSCGSRSPVPWLSAFVYLTSTGVVLVGRFAVLDSLLSCFVTGTLISFFLACEQKAGTAKERYFLLATGLFAGCAFLTKGFLAFAVPVLTAAPYLLWQKRWKDCFRMLLLPLLGAVLVSLPWAITIHVKEPGFWNRFFWHEHIHRFFADSAQHAEPFWFFMAVLPALFIPWIFIFPAAVTGIRTKKWDNKAELHLFQYCLCWFVFPFLFFSASNGKLITYILPCIPPLAILSGFGINEIISKKSFKSFQIGSWTATVFMGIILLALITTQLFAPNLIHLYVKSWKWVLLSIGLAAMIVFIVAALSSQEAYEKVIFFGVSPVLLLFVVNFTMPDMVLQRKAPGVLLEQYTEHINPDTVLLSGEEVARAVCYYFKRDNVYLIERAGELHYGFDHDPSRKVLSPEEAGRLIREHPGNVILVADQDDYQSWQQFFPKPVGFDFAGSKGYLLIRY